MKYINILIIYIFIQIIIKTQFISTIFYTIIAYTITKAIAIIFIPIISIIEAGDTREFKLNKIKYNSR